LEERDEDEFGRGVVWGGWEGRGGDKRRVVGRRWVVGKVFVIHWSHP